MIWRLLMLGLLMTEPVMAATYYVATTGNDANAGTAASPWRNPHRCAKSPVTAGDTCIVGSGTYQPSDIGRNDITIYISASQNSVAGSAANPITIRSETPRGAIIKVKSVNAGSAGIYIAQPGYIIEGFDINGTGTTWNTGSSASAAGVTIAASDVTVRNNHIWDIARTLCGDMAFGQSGILITNNTPRAVVEENEINKIGRLRNGESGCSTTHYQHDHGIYSAGADYVTIRRNVFYDVNRGYAVHVYASGTIHDNISITHNTFHGGSPTGAPPGQIILCNTISNITIKNNIFSAAPLGYPVDYCPGTTATNTEISYNIQDSNDGDAVDDMQTPSYKPSTGITNTGNIFNATLGLTNTTAGSEDFTLTASSAAINAGAVLSEAYCGAAPDMGAFETCGPISATINGQSLDVTFGTTILPVQVISGIFSVSCSGAGCGTPVVSNLSTLPSTGNVVRATITGITGTNCAAGQTWTVSLNTAVLTDSSKIGGTLNQKVLSFTSFAVTNACSGSPPTPPAGPNIIYEMDENTGTTLTNTGSGGAGLNGTLTGGGTWGTGLTGSGVVLTSQSAQYVAIPYGNAIDPSTQSLTISFWVNVDPANVALSRSYFGSALGTNQRFYITTLDSTWRLGIQSSNDGTIGDIAVTSGMTHVCLKADSSTDIATLSINGVASTSAGSRKAYTSFALASNFELGRIGGVATGAGGTFDKLYIYPSAEDCAAIYAAQLPLSSSTGTFTLQTYRFESGRLGVGGAIDTRTALDTALSLAEGGYAALHLQIRCDNVANCSSTAFPLYYSVDGGGYDYALDDVATSHGIRFYGSSSDDSLNRFIADGPLTGALSHTDGPTSMLSSHVSQSYTLAQNSSLTVRYLIYFGAGTANHTFRFRPKRGNGLSLDTYTVSPQVDVIPARAMGGP